MVSNLPTLLYLHFKRLHFYCMLILLLLPIILADNNHRSDLQWRNSSGKRFVDRVLLQQAIDFHRLRFWRFPWFHWLFFAVTVEGSSTFVLQRSSSVAPASLRHVLEASSCVPAAPLQRWSPLSLRPQLVVCAAFSSGWRWFERAKNDWSSWMLLYACALVFVGAPPLITTLSVSILLG